MPTIDPRQATSIARFLATSRAYFSLPERRLVTRSVFQNLRWALLRLALLAGGTGAMFGSAAMAENETRTARSPAGTTQLTALATPSRRSGEKIP
jgi:hypothetical protein